MLMTGQGAREGAMDDCKTPFLFDEESGFFYAPHMNAPEVLRREKIGIYDLP